MQREFQIRFLKQVGLEPQHYLLDLGCGTLRGGIPIIDYLDRGHYFGLDTRQEVLDEGMKELVGSQLENKQPTLIAAPDTSSVKLDQTFDYIWAFAVLIHMNDAILDGTMNFIRQHLKDDGVFYGTVNIGTRPDGSWQGFPVVARSLQFYEDACSRNGLRVEELGPLTDFGHRLPSKSVEQQSAQRMLKIWNA